MKGGRSTTRPRGVAAGDVVVQADLVGVARQPIAANTPGSLAVMGVFDFPKATGADTGIAAGDKVYWDVADKQAKADDETGPISCSAKRLRPRPTPTPRFAS